MKFLSDILAKAGLTVDGVVTLNNTATGQTPNANDNSTKLATTAWVRTFVQPYSLPIATSSVLGGIKVGTGLSIDAGTGVLSVSGGGSASIKSTQTFTATAGQTVFTISGGYSVGLIDVFLNGVYLSPNQTTATNGTTVTLGDAALAGDVIDVIIASPVYQGATTTTDQLPEGSTNLYFTNARARAAISESVTGLDYNSATGVLSITTGYGIPTTASQTTWDAAYNDKINSAAVTGTTTKTLTLTQQDGGTITASWTDDNTDAVTSVFGRTGAVVAVSGDYTTALVTEVTNLYYTDARARAAISVTGSGSYNSATGVITVTGGVTSVNTLTGAVTLTTTNIGEGTNLYYTTARANSDFDTRLATKSTTNLAEGTNLYYTTARANSDFDTRLATKSTTNLAEGTNLYYTDTRVGTYLTGNSYATQSYVSTQINNLVSGAPGLLDTLDELAAALGDDPNFATTVTTALGNRLRIDTASQGLTGTQQGYGRTNLGLGSLSTLSSIGDAYITDLAYSKLTGVPSTFAPSAHTHDDRYYTETEIGNFFSGASAITGYNKTNWDTAYGWGNHASGGYLTTASAASTYVSLSGSYANPSWITSLAYSKITGVPAFITSYTEVDTLATVTGRGASTSTAVTFSTSATIGRVLIDYDGTDSWFRMQSGNRMRITTTGGTDFIIPNTGNMTYNGNTVWHAGNDGSGSGLDADTVDGVQLDNIVYGNVRGTNDSITTDADGLDRTGFYTSSAFTTRPSGVSNWMYIQHIKLYNSNTLYQKQIGYDTYDDRMWVRTKNSGNWTSWKQIWTSESLTNLNQLTNGPGYVTDLSGYVTLAGVQTITGKKTFSNAFGDSDPVVAFTGTSSASFQYITTAYNATISAGQTIAHFIGRASSSRMSAYIGYQYAAADSNSNFLSLGHWGYDHLIKLYPTGQTIISGAVSASNISSSVTASYIVQRDANGYIYANHVNFSTTESENPVISSFITSNGDGWSRKSSLAHVRSQLGNYGGWITGYTETDTLASVTARGATTTAAITISREAFSYGGTTQSFLIDGAGGNGALTINAASAYAYLTFAQAGVSKFEIGAEGAATNKGSIYFNHNVQVGSTGAALYLKKSNGYVGINQIDPSYQLHINTSANEGIYLKGSSGGVWMNIQSAAGNLWSVGAQNDGMGIYNRTSSSYAFFIKDNRQLQIAGYTSSSSYSGTAAGYLAFDSSGNIITVASVAGTDSSKLPLAGGVMTGSIVNNTDGAVILESNASENNNWLWKESSKAWGLFWFNRGSQSGQTIGGYTTVGAELMFMGGNSGVAMPSGWTGHFSGSYIAAMISNYTGYIYSASTIYAVGSMRASEFRGNANVASTGEAIYAPAGVYSTGTNWLYGTMYLNGNSVNDVSSLGIIGATTTPINITGASHKYLTINPGNGYEAMVRYIGGSGSSWYVGKRTSSQLVGTQSFHFYSEEVAATVGGITPGGIMYVNNKFETTRSTGTMFSHGSMSDAIGYNGSYGTYIGSVVGGTYYIYANGTFYDNGTIRTLIHSGNIGSQSVSSAGSALSLSLNALGNGSVNVNNGASAVYRNENGAGGNMSYAPVLHLGGGDTMWQIQGDYYNSSSLQWRAGYAGSWYAWRQILHTGNYGSYVVPVGGGTFTGNVKITPVSESWAEGLTFIMPTTTTWGGLRWQRQRGGNDGNWYVGFTALDATDDLVFGANNGGAQVNNIIRLTKAGNVSTQGSFTASGDVTAYSDIRVKENILTIDNALEKTLALRGVYYNRTDKEDKSQKIGVIAQEVQQVLPQLVQEQFDGMLGVSYGNMAGLFIEAIKEQQIQIESQKSEIDELKGLVQQLINR